MAFGAIVAQRPWGTFLSRNVQQLVDIHLRRLSCTLPRRPSQPRQVICELVKPKDRNRVDNTFLGGLCNAFEHHDARLIAVTHQYRALGSVGHRLLGIAFVLNVDAEHLTCAACLSQIDRHALNRFQKLTFA